MPSGGYFHPGGTVHIHSRLRSQVWVLDVDAESVLPDALTRGGDAQSRSVALPYEYDYNGSLTRESQLPAELAATVPWLFSHVEELAEGARAHVMNLPCGVGDRRYPLYYLCGSVPAAAVTRASPSSAR